MSTIIRLSCDKCQGEAPLTHMGTTTDARVAEFREGWFYTVDAEHGAIDLCPVCSGRKPDYWTAEPF